MLKSKKTSLRKPKRPEAASSKPKRLKSPDTVDWSFSVPTVFEGAVEKFLETAPAKPVFDMIITSPPYNIGKEYEKRETLEAYLKRQEAVIGKLIELLKPSGSLCWQVGNFVARDEIIPLDFEYHRIFRKLGMKLQNRIIWQYGHGMHGRRRFSGRYEVVLWYTKGPEHKFNLDAVRIKSKYPGKRSYKGKNKGEYSSNPLGKNPEDVWQIPNVNGNHMEKTSHPCQFPVGLIERLVLALTDKKDLVFDPYCGVASAGVAAVHHGRRFVGCEKVKRYVTAGTKRLQRAQTQQERFRPHNQPIYDHTKSNLSKMPDEKQSRE